MITRLIPALLLMPTFAFADWEPLAPLPEPNGGFACGFVNGQLIVAGGTNWKDDTKHWLDVIWRYDPASNQWTSVGKLPQPCAYGASGILDGKLVIAGGSEGNTALKDVISVDGKGQCLKLGELPEGRVYCAATVLDNELWIAGGATDPVELKTLTNTVFRLAIDHGMVRVLAEDPAGVIGFGIAAAATGAKRAFVFGGAQFDAATQVKNLRVVRVLNGPSPKDGLRQEIRGLSAVALSEGHIYLGGGYPSDAVGFTDQAWIYLAAVGKAIPAKALPMKSMMHFATDGEWVYCLGGEDKKKHRNAQMWRIGISELLAPTVRP